MPFNRRCFLFSSAAATALAMLLRRRAWSATDTAGVIVIGARLAGLNAALRLEAAGFRVLVIEGRDRQRPYRLRFS